MIVYDLACEKAHRFEGWFSSAEDFDAQVRADQVSCPVCGSVSVSRQLSAPYVNTGSPEPAEGKPGQSAETAVAGVDIESLHRKFVEFVLQNSEDVGNRFAEEARKIHYEEEPRRSIRGQASSDEIEALRDEGIDIFQVPDVPVPPDQVH